MDGVATLLGGNLNQAVRLVQGATKALKAKNLSVWIANDKTQQRGVKQYYVTESAGYLVVAVVVIKDSKIPLLKMKLWSKDGGYELWTVYLPNPKRAAARNEVVASTAIAATATRDIVPRARREVRNQEADNAFDDLDLANPETVDDGEDEEGGPNEGSRLGVLMMEKLFCEVFLPAMVKRREDMIVHGQDHAAVSAMEIPRVPTPPTSQPRSLGNNGPRTRNIQVISTSSSSSSTASSSSSSASSSTMPLPIASQLPHAVAAGTESSGFLQPVVPILGEISLEIRNSVPRNGRANSNVTERDEFVAALRPTLPPAIAIVNNEFGEPILFMYDGDFDQIEATWSRGLEVCNRLGIEIFKIPGGGSLQWQPNDLMRAHNIIHSYCSSSRYHAKIHEFEPPYWLDSFEKSLTDYGIDKASRDCFVNFMRQIPTILSQAFSVTNTRGGWKGLCPPDTRFILNKCDQFNSANFTDAERARIVNTIDSTFIPESILSGMIEDDRITEERGDLVSDMTHKFNFHRKPTNHQRAIWWNSDGQSKSGVLAVREAEVQRRQDKVVEAAEVAKRKTAKAAATARKAAVDALFLGGYANFTENRNRRCHCSNDCSPQVRLISVETDDGWRGCPVAGCLQFYCAKASCKTKLLNHVKNCMQKLPI